MQKKGGEAHHLSPLNLLKELLRQLFCLWVLSVFKKQPEMDKVRYIGTNYEEVKRLCGDKVLAPYFCMGFTMLSVDTGEGFVSVYEGDDIVREDDGTLRIEGSRSGRE